MAMAIAVATAKRDFIQKHLDFLLALTAFLRQGLKTFYQIFFLLFFLFPVFICRVFFRLCPEIYNFVLIYGRGFRVLDYTPRQYGLNWWQFLFFNCFGLPFSISLVIPFTIIIPHRYDCRLAYLKFKVIILQRGQKWTFIV